MTQPTLVFLHDDGDLREIARDFASSLPCRLVLAASSQEAMLRLGGGLPDAILAGGKPEDAREARTVSVSAPLMLIAGIDDEWRAFQAGAVAFLSPTLSIVEWREAVALAARQDSLAALAAAADPARTGGDVEALRSVATRWPQDAASAWAQYLSALVLLSTGHLQDAVEELSALTEDHDHAWRAHERLAAIWRTAGDKAAAEIHEERVRAMRDQHAAETTTARAAARESHRVPSLALDAMDTQPEMIPVEQRFPVAPLPPPLFPPAPAPTRAPMPMPPPDVSVTQPDMPAAASRHEPSAPLASILVADDSELVREMISEALTEAGYRVRTAADGRTALDLARRERPDLLILDGLMPGVHGFDVCKAVKQELYPKDPPKVVILSAIYTKQRQKSEAVTLYGADEVLSKPVAGPFDGNELVAVVKRHLGT